jgi:hypothetical protein
VSQYFRTILILVFAAAVAVAYSPATFADKKNNSNSSNSDDKKDKDKDKDNDNDNQRHNSGRKKGDDQKSSGGQQFQNFQQGSSGKQKNNDKQNDNSDKQGGSKNSQPVIINNNINGPQGGQFPKSIQGQNFQKQPGFNGQKQGNPPQNLQKQNFQFQGAQNKPDWIDKSHHDHKDMKNFVVKFGGPEPFSKKWYNDHPKAWHYDHHDHNDAWKYATAASLVGFLGWEAYHPHNTVVVYQPVPYDTLFVSRPGVIIDPSRGEWMPLGQYTLMLGPNDDSTRMLDLAIDRFGHIRGSYYDMVSGVAHNVAGIVDQRTQYAQWSLESNRQMTFYTPMGEMMQPQGLVYVQLPSGERQQWQLVRMDAG